MARAAHDVHRYPDPTCRTLRRALAERFGVSPDQIVVANGADNLITLLAHVMLGPGRMAAIPEVSFATYEIASLVSGAGVVKVPMRGHGIDPDGMAGALAAGAKVAFVANPNNPTGTILTAAEVDAILRAAPDGSIVVLDEAYADFVTDPRYPDSPALVRDGQPVVVLRTFSKAYGLAGLRVGFALCPPPVAAALWQVREAFATNRVAEAAAEAALADTEHYARTRGMIVEGRRALARALAEMGLEVVPSEANYLWVKAGVPSTELAPRLAREGVLIRPGHLWGLPSFIRVSVGTADQNERFVEALQRVLAE